MGPSGSRYAIVSRRALLKGMGVAAAAGAAAGCSSGKDEQVFVSPQSVTISASVDSPSPGSSASSAFSGGSSSGASGASGVALPASAKLSVSFTLAAGSAQGGTTHNPYVAVWLENTQEELASTIAVWHSQQNERWLNELKRWYTVSGGYEAHSGPTKVAGSYTVEWDGGGVNGAKLTAGQYFLCIEANREHGSYELIRQEITLGGTATGGDLTAQGDLTKASYRYTV